MLTIVALLVVPFVLATEAAASELIARKATNVKLEVSRNGSQALLSYKVRGRSWYVLAGGAVDAKQPARGGRQVSFRLRRSTTRPPFRGSCTRIHPAVPELDLACAAGRTSWAVQSWQRTLPNFGVAPSASRAQSELRLSHWSGSTAVLTLKADWSFAGKWPHVYGNLIYRGKPVYRALVIAQA